MDTPAPLSAPVPAAPGPDSSKAPSPSASLRAQHAQRQQASGKKRGSYKEKWAAGAGGAAAVPGQELFTPANTGRLLEAAFAVPVVWTGCPHFALDEHEVKELSGSAALVGNEFVKVEPKWVALSLFGLSLGGIILTKILTYAAWKQALAVQGGSTPQAPAPAPRAEKTPPPRPAAETPPQLPPESAPGYVPPPFGPIEVPKEVSRS